MRHEYCTRRGEGQGSSSEEGGPKSPLKLANLSAEWRLRHVECSSGSLHAALIHYGHDVAQPPQLDLHTFKVSASFPMGLRHVACVHAELKL